MPLKRQLAATNTRAAIARGDVLVELSTVPCMYVYEPSSAFVFNALGVGFAYRKQQS